MSGRNQWKYLAVFLSNWFSPFPWLNPTAPNFRLDLTFRSDNYDRNNAGFGFPNYSFYPDLGWAGPVRSLVISGKLFDNPRHQGADQRDRQSRAWENINGGSQHLPHSARKISPEFFAKNLIVNPRLVLWVRENIFCSSVLRVHCPLSSGVQGFPNDTWYKFQGILKALY